MTLRTENNLFDSYYPGFIILLALLFGGTTVQGIWSDDLIYALMIPAVIIGYTNFFSNMLGVASRCLVVFILLIIIMQFLPIHIDRNLPELNDVSNAFPLWTTTLSRTLNAAITTLTLLGFFLYLSSLKIERLYSLVMVVFIGVAINATITVVQLSYSTKIAIHGFFPYTIRMGLFENENHFSALSYLVIPLFAWYFLRRRWSPLVYVLFSFILVALQFAVGARAGMILTTNLSILCFLWAITFKSALKTKILTLVAGGGLLVFLALSVELPDLLDDSTREIYTKNTWDIANSYWLTGTGLGSFYTIWPIFETKEILGEEYTTRVHNDHVELYLELGIWYFMLLIFFVGLIAKNAFRNDFIQAAVISIFAILFHSLVDFPLRTSAISVVFTLLVAIVLTSKAAELSSDASIQNTKRRGE